VFLDDGQVQHVGPVEDSIHAYLDAVGAFGSGNKQPDSHSRSVFGPITINDGSSGTISHAEPLVVSSSFRVDEGVSGFNLYFMLEDMQGTRVVHLLENSKDLGFQDSADRHRVVRVALPPLWLNPGVYSVYFKVRFWGDQGAARHVSDTFPLDVDGQNSSSQRAMLHPAAEWSIEPAGEKATMIVAQK
jgi:lipopolysaccharide transport system ATP-binding protein